MARNKKEVNDIGYLSAPKTSVKMSIKGADYLVESYFIGKKNVHDTLIVLAEREAYEEMLKSRKIKGGCEV